MLFSKNTNLSKIKINNISKEEIELFKIIYEFFGIKFRFEKFRQNRQEKENQISTYVIISCLGLNYTNKNIKTN